MNLIVVIGHTGQGKTPYINRFLGNAASNPDPISKKSKYRATNRSKRQYIFDVNNEYLFPADRGPVSPQMRHVDGDVKRFISVAKGLKNTNVIFEDATGFLRGKQSEGFARLLTQKMFSKNNYILVFHSINRVPPEIMEMSNYIVLFKTNDNFDVIDKKFRNEKVNNAFLKLKNQPKGSFIEIATI